MAVRGIPLAPLTGKLDIRGQPDLMESGSLRMRQNFSTSDEKVIERGAGWQKLFSQAAYNNTDFHDQLLTFGGTTREPITMLAEVESSNKARWLFLATQSRIAKLNQYTGNWTILGTGFGGGIGADLTGPRFQCAVLGDYVTFTNGVDMPMYYVMDSLFTADQVYTGVWSNPNGNITPANQSDTAQYFQENVTPVVLWDWDEINLVWTLSTTLLQTFQDLELINLTTARKTWMWRNCLFLADVTMDGTRLSYRIVWSDYNDPISFDPSVNGSITGFLDLDFGETILGAKPAGNSLLIYTNLGIWEMYVLDTANSASTSATTTSVFGVRKLPGIEKKSCLKYENTLADAGEYHIYMGTDRIYAFNQWMTEPDELEWINSAGSVLYDNIQDSICQAHVACIHNDEVLFSVLTANSKNGCPDITLRINKTYRTADVVDAGFTALCEYRSQMVPTIRDWIIDQNICTPAELINAGYGWTNEGLPNPLPTPSAPFTPTVIYTHETQTVAGVVTEDWTQPQASSDSLCALLSQEGFGSLLSYCEKCDTSPSLVGVGSIDWCLKEVGSVYYRERCANPTAIGASGDYGYTSSSGSYLLDGYTSIIRFAPIFGPGKIAQIEKILLNFLTVLSQSSQGPTIMNCRIGLSGQLYDPNSTNPACIKWISLTPKQLKCLSKLTAAQYASRNITPSDDLTWNMFLEARFIYIELSIAGTGGECSLSGIMANVNTKEINY